MAEKDTLSIAAWWQQRVCAVCGDPGTDAHHIVLRSLGGDDHIDNLLLLCHGCHMAFHEGVGDVRRAAGSALQEWPEKIQHARDLLGPERASHGFLSTYYWIEG